eukprot:188925-Amphidinium_carterae.1
MNPRPKAGQRPPLRQQLQDAGHVVHRHEQYGGYIRAPAHAPPLASNLHFHDMMPPPHHITVPDDDDENGDEEIIDDSNGDDDVIEEDEPVLVREDRLPYPRDHFELSTTPDHLDWTAQCVVRFNREQHLTWDACFICGMYVVNRWCSRCHRC